MNSLRIPVQTGAIANAIAPISPECGGIANAIQRIDDEVRQIASNIAQKSPAKSGKPFIYGTYSFGRVCPELHSGEHKNSAD